MQERTCSIEGCTKPLCARTWCQMHYTRWKKHGDPHLVKHKYDGNRINSNARKDCMQCGESFGPPPHCAHAQWARRRFCSRPCKNRWAAQRQTKAPTTTRREGERWARWWEQQRRTEDKADIKAWKPKVWPHCRLTARPQPRLFLAGHCIACGEPWVDYLRRRPSGYCSVCHATHWRADSRRKRRARKAMAVLVETVRPEQVFKRDDYRCQICKRKTRGKYPAKRSPTVDHIIPLAQGGDHSYLNAQCACLDCNVRKGDRAANDQLRLVA